MKGIIEGRIELWAKTPDGRRYKIHISERYRLAIGVESVGLPVEFDTADEIFSPRDFDGWVRNGSLRWG